MNLHNRRLRQFSVGAVALAGIGGLGIPAVAHNIQDLATMHAGPAPVIVTPLVQAAAVVSPNIVGGQPVAAPSWIAQTMWDYKRSPDDPGDPTMPQCSGSLIMTDVVLTAGHCYTTDSGQVIDPVAHKLHVLIGSPCTPDTGSQLYYPDQPPVNGCDKAGEKLSGVDMPVTRLVVVPSWDWGIPDSQGRIGDLLLEFLNGYVPNLPVDLAKLKARIGTAVTQLGYGRTNPSNTGPEPGILYGVNDNTVAPASTCDKADPSFPIGPDETCVTAKDFTSACGGDSGGPLLEKVNGDTVLAGDVSRSAGTINRCGLDPNVYASVGYYYGWIMAVLSGVDPVDAMAYLPGGAPAIKGHVVQHGPVTASMQDYAHQWQSEYHLAG